VGVDVGDHGRGGRGGVTAGGLKVWEKLLPSAAPPLGGSDTSSSATLIRMPSSAQAVAAEISTASVSLWAS